MAYWIDSVKKTDNVQLIAKENCLTVDYWVGNSNVIIMSVPEAATEIVGTFTQFPNVSEVVISNHDGVVTGLDTAFAGTKAVTAEGTFWVADDLLSAYQAAYPTLNFDTWPNYATWVIPTSGSGTLTAAYVAQEIAKLSVMTQYIRKVVIPSSFVAIEADALDPVVQNCPNAFELELTLTGNLLTQIPQLAAGGQFTKLTANSNADSTLPTSSVTELVSNGTGRVSVQNNKSIVKVHAEEIAVSARQFEGTSSLVELSLPNAVRANEANATSFGGTGLTELSLPSLTTAGTGGYAGGNLSIAASLPNAIRLYTPKLTGSGFGSRLFSGSPKLRKWIIDESDWHFTYTNEIPHPDFKYYFKFPTLTWYLCATGWKDVPNHMVGVYKPTESVTLPTTLTDDDESVWDLAWYSDEDLTYSVSGVVAAGTYYCIATAQ